ncbi:8-oxoguanine deaminase [Dendrosporobacter sp. 1207_IL3150]|uniref:8-oxoguanine deaminase n=1 Tax=Dendrosporobacter sp. 1207_IL3150 TaxID=3084054 RepID=UPI002FDA87A1
MKTLLIKNAQAIVTMDDFNTVLENTNIFIENNVITYIGEKEFAADEIIDASHHYVYPGLVNTHHHLYQTFTRNLPQVQKLELFDWLTTLYEIWRGITPEVVYYSSLTGMGELLKYGCTTCFDHHYVFPSSFAGELIDRQFAAAAELGIRFHASRGSMSRGKNDGGLPPNDLVQSVDQILDDSLRLVEKYHNPDSFSMQQVVLAPCSPFSVTSDLMVKTAELARQKNVRLHTHLAETKDEEDYCIEKFGMRPLAYMESLGWIGPDVWYAHGIHFTDDELKKLAETQTGVAHCPVSNQKLSSGIAQIPRMLELGVPVGLAVDGSASNDCSNLLAELRVAYLLHRLNSSESSPEGNAILRLATRGGAKLLGRDDIGSIELGKAADLFLIDINRVEYVGTQFDPQSLLATVGVNRPTAYTIVNGRVVSKAGELCLVDEHAVVQEANRQVTHLLKRL